MTLPGAFLLLNGLLFSDFSRPFPARKQLYMRDHSILYVKVSSYTVIALYHVLAVC